MSDWREEERAEEDTKRKLLIGAGAVVAILVWMFLARPGDEAPSSQGFNLGGSGASPSGVSDRPFLPRGQKTGLDFVGNMVADVPASAKPDVLPGSSPPPDAAAAGPSSAAPPAASPSPTEDMSAADKKQADRMGVPKTPAEAADFGGSRNLWSSLMPKIAAYPGVLGYLLNNKYVVSGYMNRMKTKEVCSSPKAMSQYLFDPNKPDGATRDLPLVMQVVRANPGLTNVIAGSKLAQELINCPGMQGVLADPSLMMGIASNPKMLGVLMDPAVVKGLASTPSSAQILGGFQKTQFGQ